MSRTDTAAPMVRLREVRKVYPRGNHDVVALDGVSLDIPRGDFAAVIGPSGSGKSTLLHLVGGLDTATSGDLEVEGLALAGLPDRALTLFRRDRVGFVFQFFNLLPTMTARENVMLPALLAGVRPTEARHRAEALLSRVSLSHRREHRPDELSGGEMQRVAIARALIRDAPLLVADEPTGNLDSRTGQEIIALLAQLHQEGVTILLGTHDAKAIGAATTVFTLQDGRLPNGAS